MTKKIGKNLLKVKIRKIDEEILNEDDPTKLAQLVEVRKLLNEAAIKKDAWYSRLEPDTIVNSVVSITSILMILNYEKTDIITTKAMSIFNKMVGK